MGGLQKQGQQRQGCPKALFCTAAPRRQELWPHVTGEETEGLQGEGPPPSLSSWPLFWPGHGSGTLWNFVTVTVALGLTNWPQSARARELGRRQNQRDNGG